MERAFRQDETDQAAPQTAVKTARRGVGLTKQRTAEIRAASRRIQRSRTLLMAQRPF